MKTFKYLDNTAILTLDVEKCTGCRRCIMVCPHSVFAVRHKVASIVKPNSCMECGACVKNCPENALYTNPDDGCGCAAYIISSWVAKLRGKPSNCGC